MTDNLSQRIIDFMGGLSPVYDRYYDDNKRGAISLEHGHIYLTPDEDEACEEGCIKVCWNSSLSNYSHIHGIRLVELAIARYAQLRSIPQIKESSYDFKEMASHFEVKTGSNIEMDMLEDESIGFWVMKGIGSLGKDAVIGIIKAKLGL